jgi:hypothetical protein
MNKHLREVKNIGDEFGGARVIRHKNHICLELLTNHRMVVVSSTPSDVNSHKKVHADFQRATALPVSKGEVEDFSPPDEASTEPKARFRPPVRDQVVREDPGILILPSGGSSVHPPGAPPLRLRFESVSELVSVADEVDSFWNLNAEGRTQVLMKLAGGFAEEVDVIGTRSYKTSLRGFEWFLAKADRHDPVLALWGFDWQMPITRSLYIKTPDGQVQIVETESKRVLEGTAQIAVILVKSDPALDERAEVETVGDEREPEFKKIIFHHFIRTPKMRARDLHFVASQEWLDPQVTRPVVSEMLDVLAERRKP